MASLSNYVENRLIDQLFRGTAYSFPATLYIGLFTVEPTAAGGGTEVTGGSYARVAVTASLANWAGTQGAGTTAVSSGTSGETSNNAAITFPAPTAAWGSITSLGIFDAATGGDLIIYANLTTPKTVNSGDPAPLFTTGALTFSIS